MFSPDQWLASTGVSFYNGVATQSLRFDNARNSFLNRTPSIAGNQKTWTWSGWVKRNNSTSPLFRSVNASGFVLLRFLSDQINLIWFSSNTAQWSVTTNALYRDFSAWYHIVVAFDTTQGTASNRVKIYVNGVQETSLATASYPNQNHDSLVNQTLVHSFATTGALDAYMAEVNFIDGLSFFSDTSGTPNTSFNINSFGETKNGVWIAKEYTGSYGTNGFRLQFNQTGTGTASASTIGADTSGNTNHWTSSGIVASDCNMPDNPENNFSTINPLIKSGNTFSEGNLKVTTTTTVPAKFVSTLGVTSGKWFMEFRHSGDSNYPFGITSDTQQRNYLGMSDGSTSVSIWGTSGNSNAFVNGSQVSWGGSGTTWSAGDIIGLALNADDSILEVYKNGSSIGSYDYSGLNWSEHFFAGGNYVAATYSPNFGQDSTFQGAISAGGNADGNDIGDFKYAPPSGYLALCSANLPEPTISPNADTQADDYFNTFLYTGSGSSPNAITGVGFQPDWVWIKNRTATVSHAIFDSSRGVTSAGATNKAIGSDRTDAEGNGNGGLSAFGSDGFTLVDGSSGSYPRSLVNDATTYVSWNWKANGGTTSTNDDGNVTATVQANTDAGFSICTYSGNSSALTIGHGLGKKPAMVIVKNRTDNSTDWIIGHKDLSSGGGGFDDNKFLKFSTLSTFTNSLVFGTEPTTTTIALTTGNAGNLSTSGKNYVAYCFAEIEGYSRFGKYTGNSSSTGDGTFVYLGFKPSFVMLKDIGGGEWGMFDSARNTFNVVNKNIGAQSSGAEYSGDTNRDIDFLSNGFKLRNGSALVFNNSSRTYIYMAFGETFKYANAR